MDDATFFDRFKKLLEKIREKYELDNIHDALLLWFGENYFYLDPEDIKDRIVRDSHAEGIDGIFVDEKQFNLLFVQGETVSQLDNTQNNFSETKLKSTLQGARFLLKGDYKSKITPELENYTDEYHEFDKTGNYKTKILFIILKQKPVGDKFIEDFKREFPEVDVIFFDFDFIKNYYIKEYLVSRALPPDKISFQVLKNLLKKDEPYKARVFTAKAEELARLYNDHKERIFQQNVRFSLGLKSKSINEQILETARSDDKSKNFWYFNNGINIVCSKLKPTTNEKIVNLYKAQIINGAQTTYSLYEAFKNGELKGDTEVLIRAIETTDKDFTDLVTLYTNSQNAIRLRDLCSNDDIQTKNQKILKDTYNYFYERKRGEFDSLYPTKEAKKGAFGDDYEDIIISNEKAAQAFLAMFENMPAEAKSQKARIFMKDEGGFYKKAFNIRDEILAEKFLMSWSLLRFIEKNKKEYRKKYNSAEELENEDERLKIYAYGFLLHSESFILNLFKDFLKKEGFDLNKKEDLIKIVDLTNSEDETITKIYDTIKETLAKYVEKLEDEEPTYYHNKFFKNDKSIALIRNFFKNDYAFVELLT